jgi:hypothetical protein
MRYASLATVVLCGLSTIAHAEAPRQSISSARLVSLKVKPTGRPSDTRVKIKFTAHQNEAARVVEWFQERFGKDHVGYQIAAPGEQHKIAITSEGLIAGSGGGGIDHGIAKAAEMARGMPPKTSP